MEENGAWRIAHGYILAVQRCDSGYDYSVLNRHYVEIDGGIIEDTQSSMAFVVEDLMSSYGLNTSDPYPMDYFEVMEKMFDAARSARATEPREYRGR